MNPDEAEKLLAEDTVDLVAFGRSFIADPNWPNKAMHGHEADITPCIRCLQCYHISTNRRNVGCSVNPHYHNERFIEKTLMPAAVKKKVVIIGAGPAGIVAAVTASKRGHDVILLEKRSRVGGALHYVAMEHYKEDIKNYLVYLENQLSKSKVDVQLNTAATLSMVENLHPDAVIVACGAEPLSLNIPGAEQAHVLNFYEAIEHEELIKDQTVIIGGGTIGAEIALELAELKGKHVTIIEMGNCLAAQGNMLYKIALRQKYEQLKQPIKIHYYTTCNQINKDHVIASNKEGVSVKIPAETVIIAAGVKTNRKLVDSFYGIIPEIYEVGDALKPRKIQEAVFEAYGVASII